MVELYWGSNLYSCELCYCGVEQRCLLLCIHHAADSFRRVNDGPGQPVGHRPPTCVSATERQGGDVKAHRETQKHHECVKVSREKGSEHELREGIKKKTAQAR